MDPLVTEPSFVPSEKKFLATPLSWLQVNITNTLTDYEGLRATLFFYPTLVKQTDGQTDGRRVTNAYRKLST